MKLSLSSSSYVAIISLTDVDTCVKLLGNFSELNIVKDSVVETIDDLCILVS